MPIRFQLAPMLVGLLCISSWATDFDVTTPAELRAALQKTKPGDRVLLASHYSGSGRIDAHHLRDVTITSRNPAKPAVLDAGGGSVALRLYSPRNVTVAHIVVQNWTGNGISIDDSDQRNRPASKAEYIYVHDVIIRNDRAPAGNRDGLKLSGVDHFLVDRCQFSNWGTEQGSAIDAVGTHFGLIQNCHMVHEQASSAQPGTAIQLKGGTKGVVVRANYIRLNAGRSIAIGGRTADRFFRFVPGESGYEADDITAIGNLLIGGDSAANYINVNGGLFAYNYLEGQNRWVLRILNENPTQVPTQSGVFRNNIVVFGGPGFRQVSNVGPDTRGSSFVFTGNQWFNQATGGPASQTPLQLSATETGGIYGVDPKIKANTAVTFDMPWGRWVVNPHPTVETITVPDFRDFELARATIELGLNAAVHFNPLADDPISSAYTLTPLTQPTIPVPARSQLILIRSTGTTTQAGVSRERNAR